MPWLKLSEVPPSVAKHKDVPLTLAQANWVARIADALEKKGNVDEPWAVAWAQFARSYRIEGGHWVKRKTQAQEAVTVAATKTEDGVKFSASAYAYVPDAEKPSTWKIRLEETPGRVTRKQLGAAAAAFSPGGFRGQKVQIPSADVAKVKAKIRAAYAKLGVEKDDIPKSVQEAASKGYRQAGRVQELFAATELEPLGDGDFRVQIQRHGRTEGGERYYTQEALKAAVAERIWDNAKMYINHEPVAEQARRGHRDLRGWGATIKPGSPTFTGSSVEAIAHAHAPEALAFLEDQVAKKAVALSPDSSITYYAGRIDGEPVEVVERINKCHSVDFVDAGNIGGRVLEAAPNKEGNDMPDLEGLTVEVLQEARPELVEEIEARAQEAAKDDVAKQIEEAQAKAVKEHEEARVAEAKKAEEAEEQKRQAETDPGAAAEKQRIQEAVAAATEPQAKELAELREKDQRRDQAEIVANLVASEEGLTEASKARVTEALNAGLIPAADLPNRVQEACAAARQHEMAVLKELGAGTKVSGLGATADTVTKDQQEAYVEDLKQRLRDDGKTEEQIERLIAARS